MILISDVTCVAGETIANTTVVTEIKASSPYMHLVQLTFRRVEMLYEIDELKPLLEL